jgi:hypothetical protein
MSFIPTARQLNEASWYYIGRLTTVDGGKYHLTVNTVISGAGEEGHKVNGMLGVEDLSDFSVTGGVISESGSASPEYFNAVAHSQSLTSPQGSDNYTHMFYSANYADIAANLHF